MKQWLFLLLPVFTVAQSPVTDVPLHLREIPRHHLSIDLGIAEPTGEFRDVARSGLSVGLTYDYYFTKYVGISLAGRLSYNETAFEPTNNAEPDNERLSTITLGITASKTINRFQVDGFARMGLGFLKTNEGFFISRNDHREYIIDQENTKDSGTCGWYAIQLLF